jgi:hypothetical protein
VEEHIRANGWRIAFAAAFLALGTATAWVATEIQRGHGYGADLVVRAKRDSAMSDSIALAIELARQAVIRAEASTRETRRGVQDIKATLNKLSRQERKLQARQAREVVAKVESVKTSVDSIQSSIPVPPLAVPPAAKKKGKR